jgi:DNA repair protein RadA/Sms
MEPERVAYVLDFTHSVLPESALIATFRDVELVSELLHIFNTVWQYFPDRAVVVKSALGWPIREFKIRDEGDRLVFMLT